MSKIGFFNHNSNSDIERVATAIMACAGDESFLRLEAASGFQIIAADNAIQLCIFHSTPDDWKWDELNAGGKLDRDPGMLFCIVSSSPLEPEITVFQGSSATHYRFTVPSLDAARLLVRESQELEGAWAKFLDALFNNPFSTQDDGTIAVSDKVSWFLNPDQSALFAFRLLCAAKLECGGRNIKQKAFDTNLTIHTPDKLKDWLRTFEADSIEQAAKAIGGGRFTAQVKAVLEAAESEWSALSGAIEKFESVYKKQAQVP
jgi:hypothetical protein